jgi:toxin ParE1/3/4
MTLAFAFHPEAQAELVADVVWYDDRELGVGGRFADAVRAAIESATDDPAAWAILPGWDREPVVRFGGNGSASDSR